MTKVINIRQRDHAEIEAEARAWLVRLDGAPPGRSELREFQEWLDRSPFHRESFDGAARSWDDMDVLNRWLDAPADPGSRTRRPPVMFRRAAFVAAGVIVIAVLATWLASPAAWHRQPEYSERFATSIGEVRTVVLPDGTRVQLNTGTRIAAMINGRARLIRLDAGEAWFQVARDPQVPFVVYAGRVAVQALGTAFSVRLEGKGVDLTVSSWRPSHSRSRRTGRSSSIPSRMSAHAFPWSRASRPCSTRASSWYVASPPRRSNVACRGATGC
jgi:transmembrane sensor